MALPDNTQNLMTLPQAIRATRTCRTPLVLAALALGLFPASALAQSTSFQLRITQGNNVFLVPNGSTVTMAPSAVGQVSTATVTAIYVGPIAAVINTQPEILGSTTFTVSGLASNALPLTLMPGIPSI